jgi:hypothetical protein
MPARLKILVSSGGRIISGDRKFTVRFFVLLQAAVCSVDPLEHRGQLLLGDSGLLANGMKCPFGKVFSVEWNGYESTFVWVLKDRWLDALVRTSCHPFRVRARMTSALEADGIFAKLYGEF